MVFSDGGSEIGKKVKSKYEVIGLFIGNSSRDEFFIIFSDAITTG